MNFRTTTFFFALLLTMLWVFGLMIAHRKAVGDQSLIVPTLADAKIDSITIKRSEKGKELPAVHFEQKDENWYLKDSAQQTRVENFHIKQIIEQLQRAKPEEDADVSKDPSTYGMNAPEHVITLKGKLKDEPKEWKFYVGKVGKDNMAYVNSSDRSDKVFAVAKKNIEGLFFENPNYLRDKRLFNFAETAVTEVIAAQPDKKFELDLKRGEGSTWMFVKPPLGFAGTDNPEMPDPKKKGPKEADDAIHSVKAFLGSIMHVRVDEDSDFVPLGKAPSVYGVELGKEGMRVEILSTNDKKDAVKETLLIGKRVEGRKGKFYYARLASDDGVMQISAKYLEPIENALQDPGKIRSLDVGAFDPKSVDAVVIKQGKDEITFLLPEKLPDIPEHKFMLTPKATGWQMIAAGDKKTANTRAVETLVEQVLGKNAIVKFYDETDPAALKKYDAEWGLDTPVAEIAVYVNAVEKDVKDKEDDKKEKEKKEPLLAMRKDAKPVVTLAIGKSDKEFVHVRRTLQDGTTVSRFTVKKEFADKVLPPEGVTVAYRETALPTYSSEGVDSIVLTRMTDKGPEKLEFQRRFVDERATWYIKDPAGDKLANGEYVAMIANGLARLPIKKWVKKIDDKEDLDKYGLKTPAVSVAVTVKKHLVTTNAALNLLGSLSTNPTMFAAVTGLVAHQQADKGEVITFEFGKDTDNDKDKPGAFGRQSNSKLLFLVEPGLVKQFKETDMQDRTRMLYAHAGMEALYKANAAFYPAGVLMLLGSPHITGLVHNLDPDKVKEVRLMVRTPYELRSFAFEKNAKDKTWIDKSNLQEFKVDPDKVMQLVKDFAKLRTDRFVAFTGGPRSEHKLGPKEINVKLDLTMDDGKTVTLVVGAKFQNYGYFANTTVWPETVFFVPSTLIDPLLRGVDHFAKERIAVQ